MHTVLRTRMDWAEEGEEGEGNSRSERGHSTAYYLDVSVEARRVRCDVTVYSLRLTESRLFPCYEQWVHMI